MQSDIRKNKFGTLVHQGFEMIPSENLIVRPLRYLSYPDKMVQEDPDSCIT
ncbi:hypothetical protein Mapa_016772 [Marchantia paleacea]|nr:hypothetical protein Mapa_016772 [Marchantia paleacea]